MEPGKSLSVSFTPISPPKPNNFVVRHNKEILTAVGVAGLGGAAIGSFLVEDRLARANQRADRYEVRVALEPLIGTKDNATKTAEAVHTLKSLEMPDKVIINHLKDLKVLKDEREYVINRDRTISDIGKCAEGMQNRTGSGPSVGSAQSSQNATPTTSGPNAGELQSTISQPVQGNIQPSSEGPTLITGLAPSNVAPNIQSTLDSPLGAENPRDKQGKKRTFDEYLSSENVGASESKAVGASESKAVGASQGEAVGASQDEAVGAITEGLPPADLYASSEAPGPMRGGFVLAEGFRSEPAYHHGVDPKKVPSTLAETISANYPISATFLILTAVALGFWGFFRQERIKEERLANISHTRHTERVRGFKKSNFLLVLNEYKDRKLTFDQTKMILINTFNFSEKGALEVLQNI